MSNQLWHPSGKYFCKQCLVTGYFIDEICWNGTITTSKIWKSSWLTNISTLQLARTLDNQLRVKSNQRECFLSFNSLCLSCSISCIPLWPRPHVGDIGWVRGHCTAGRAVPASPNHQEREGNSTPCGAILGLFHVKQKEAELSCFEGFGPFMGAQLLLLECHSWSQKRFVC